MLQDDLECQGEDELNGDHKVHVEKDGIEVEVEPVSLSNMTTFEIPDSCILGSVACGDVFKDKPVDKDDDTVTTTAYSVNDTPNKVHLYGAARMQKDPGAKCSVTNSLEALRNVKYFNFWNRCKDARCYFQEIDYSCCCWYNENSCK